MQSPEIKIPQYISGYASGASGSVTVGLKPVCNNIME